MVLPPLQRNWRPYPPTAHTQPAGPCPRARDVTATPRRTPVHLQSSKTSRRPHPPQFLDAMPDEPTCPTRLILRLRREFPSRRHNAHALLSKSGCPWTNRSYNPAITKYAKIACIHNPHGLPMVSHGACAGRATYLAQVLRVSTTMLAAWGRWAPTSSQPDKYTRLRGWFDSDMSAHNQPLQ